MRASPPSSPAPASPGPAIGFHGAVTEFKRRLIEATLSQWGGNRTRAARALGLQRTYLLRHIREFGVSVPAPIGPVGRNGHRRPAPPAAPDVARGR